MSPKSSLGFIVTPIFNLVVCVGKDWTDEELIAEAMKYCQPPGDLVWKIGLRNDSCSHVPGNIHVTLTL